MPNKHHTKIRVYQELSEITSARCAKSCIDTSKYRCCEPAYCEEARAYAASQGVKLEETGNPDLPFMGPSGCTVAPHLRPTCTVHQCDIASLGFFKHTPFEVTERYFKLRQQAGYDSIGEDIA